jgi:hypothetical protein
MKVKICQDCGMEFNAFGTGETIVDKVPGFGRWMVTFLLGAGLLAGWIYEGISWTMAALTALYIVAMFFMHAYFVQSHFTKLGKTCPSCGRANVVDRDSPQGKQLKTDWEKRRAIADSAG